MPDRTHDSDAASRMVYVARAKECGCAVAVSVDEPQYKSENAKLIAQKVRAGFVVERMTVDEARALPWGWPCEHMKRAAAGIAEGQEALIV